MKVHFVKSARKARPAYGIAVGDSYYHWSSYRGPTHYSKTYPRPSQLTDSAWKEPLEAFEAIQDHLIAERKVCENRDWSAEVARDQLVELLQSLTSACEEAADMKREIADEHFGGEGPHAEQADALEEAGNEAEEAAQEVESMETDDFEGPGDFLDKLDELAEEANPENFRI